MTLWYPPGNTLVVSLACPPEMLPLPNSIVPSRNLTVPVGDAADGGPPLVSTAAVKVTGCLMVEGFGLLLRERDVEGGG